MVVVQHQPGSVRSQLNELEKKDVMKYGFDLM